MDWFSLKFLKGSLALPLMIALNSCGSSTGDRIPVAVPGSHEVGGSVAESAPYTVATSTTHRSGGDSRRFVPSEPEKTPDQLYREANIKQDFIPKGLYGRKVKRKLKPRYITIHSTQNYSAGAWQHSKALRNGKLRARKRIGGNRIGYLTWHYTVDEGVAVQHLPTNEQGEHADFNGPGNNYSLGIEMCEHHGNSRYETLERTAKLTAWLMHKHSIPLRNVVPHHHWARKGVTPEHKNCPHFLLDNGRPGAKWQAFQTKIEGHYNSITKPSNNSYNQRLYAGRSDSGNAIQRLPASYSLPSTITPIGSSAVSSTSRAKTIYHTVVLGDTLYSVSRFYGTTVSAIRSANGIAGTNIKKGQRLLIPRLG